MGALVDAMANVITVIETVAELPMGSDGVQETINGEFPLAEPGVWIFSFQESYAYTVRGRLTHPSNSQATMLLGIQIRLKQLNTILAAESLPENSPQRGMAILTDKLRKALEAASAAGTFVNSDPAIEVSMTGTDQVFAETQGLGVIEVAIDIKGYDGTN